ncbi:MAG: Fe-S cluster assembly scaffold protein NifU [Promethearchaeota archaeon]
MYSQKVIEHFTNPRNMGELDNPSGLGKVGNPVCGDLMWIYINVDENDVIQDIKFKTFGCAAAIATSSMVTEIAKGKTIQEAYRLTRKDVADSLDGLPSIKMHCSNLAADALHAAIDDFLTKQERSLEDLNRPKSETKLPHEDCCPGCAE